MEILNPSFLELLQWWAFSWEGWQVWFWMCKDCDRSLLSYPNVGQSRIKLHIQFQCSFPFWSSVNSLLGQKENYGVEQQDDTSTMQLSSLVRRCRLMVSRRARDPGTTETPFVNTEEEGGVTNWTLSLQWTGSLVSRFPVPHRFLCPVRKCTQKKDHYKSLSFWSCHNFHVLYD
jgi:hypothetical protein